MIQFYANWLIIFRFDQFRALQPRFDWNVMEGQLQSARRTTALLDASIYAIIMH